MASSARNWVSVMRTWGLGRRALPGVGREALRPGGSVDDDADAAAEEEEEEVEEEEGTSGAEAGAGATVSVPLVTASPAENRDVGMLTCASLIVTAAGVVSSASAPLPLSSASASTGRRFAGLADRLGASTMGETVAGGSTIGCDRRLSSCDITASMLLAVTALLLTPPREKPR